MNRGDRSAAGGDPEVVNDLFQSLYTDLHAMAHRQLRDGTARRSLDTTVLVHEVYLRLAGEGGPNVVEGRHLLAYASHVMRSVVVDIMRAQDAEKRGSGILPVTLSTGIINDVPASDADVLRIHDALRELASIDPTLVQIVEMRYFGGLREQEIAEAIHMSVRTVRRHWHKARIYLQAALATA